MKIKKTVAVLVSFALASSNIIIPSAQVKLTQNEALVGEGRWETAIR